MINRNNSHLTKTLSPNSFLFSFKEILAFQKPICIQINPNQLFSHAVFYPIPSISFPKLPVNTQLSLSPRIRSQAVSKETDISAMTNFQLYFFQRIFLSHNLILSKTCQSAPNCLSKEINISGMTTHFYNILSTSSAFQYCCYYLS